jgi:ssDNA thymidine ADP-ribosyltransferase, DarT
VANSDFRSEAVKEAKQAEFLIRDRFPWSFVESVGVRSQTVKAQAEAAISTGLRRPDVIMQPAWYYGGEVT